MHSANSERPSKGALHPIQESAQTAQAVSEIQRITMCPHGYHHSGSMATPALGTRDVRLHIVWIAL